MAGRVSLYFEDLGGARIDVNATGNGGNLQNQGVVPYETALDMVGVSAGNMTNAAAALIAAREPSGHTTNGWLPWGVDKGGGGVVDLASGGPVPDPTSYSPIYPDTVMAYAPFDNYDLDDLFQMRNTGSRVATILNGAGILPPDFYLFTTQSAGTDLEGRAVGSSPAFFNTRADTMLNSSFFARAGGHALPSKRPLNEIVTQLSPRELADFLESLDPVIRAGNFAVTGTDRRRILRQVATNLKDMVDVDNTVSVWSDEGADGTPGTADDNVYCGIEVTPYVVEGEVAVPTWYGIPPDTPVTQTLPGWTGGGKYIKLVNPWNVDIPLCDPSGNALYRLVLPHEYPAGSSVPRLREWVGVSLTDADGPHRTLVAVPHANDVTINFPADATVPAGGHYLIADSQATVEALTGASPATLSPDNYMIVADLRYTQESVGRPIGTETSISSFAPTRLGCSPPVT